MGDINWPWEELAAHAARNTRLLPGDVLGSGTVGTGCILEHGDGRWLRPGDVVELEIEGIGVLRNVVGGGLGHSRHGVVTIPAQCARNAYGGPR